MSSKQESKPDPGGPPAAAEATSTSAAAATPASAGEADAPAAEEALGYEQARDELSDVVQRLEAGGLTLEQSLALWERGEALARVCQQWLDGARQRLEAVMEGDRPGDQAG